MYKIIYDEIKCNTCSMKSGEQVYNSPTGKTTRKSDGTVINIFNRLCLIEIIHSSGTNHSAQNSAKLEWII